MANITIDRGHIRSRLIVEIATGTRPYSAIARDYDVTRQAIAEFAKRHHLAIADARAAAQDATAHLWVSQRTARLAEIQQTIEDIDQSIRTPTPDEDGNPVPAEDRAALYRLRLQAIRQAAEETGQLRDTAPVQTVEIRLNGVDLTALA